MYLNNIYIFIKGGLGNQLFQYALGKVISNRHNGNIVLIKQIFNNPNNTLRKFKLGDMNLKFTLLDNNLSKVLLITKIPFFLQIIKENKNFSYQKINFTKKNILLNGYWQSYKYFLNDKLELYNEFFKRNILNDKYIKYSQLICKKRSVAIHIRRGDYVTNINANQFHGVLNLNYYKKAISFFNQKIKNPNFFIFSDDINWCKKKFKSNDIIFIDEKISDEIQEMKLMSLFSNFIIANSSFSWWPAFLSINHNKVVVSPKNWISENIDLSDLIPNTWHKF